MLSHRSDPIPQAFQQHGGVPKPRVIEPAASPLRATLEMLEALDRPGPFVTPDVFQPKQAA